MNVPRPRAALTGQYYVLTWFSGRTPNISGVISSILARLAIADSPDKNSLMNVESSRNFRAKTLAHHRSYFR